tara:strand:+ start:4353 stop:4526 length:174 start_codon:yes stop_codon:yes gene_type:complete
MSIGPDIAAVTRPALKAAKEPSDVEKQRRQKLAQVLGSRKRQNNPAGVIPKGKMYTG